MPRGGSRPGAGRPAGSATRKTREIADRAAAAGELPHEFLLRVMRGEAVDGTVPTFAELIDAAKAAAPYFAPKLAWRTTYPTRWPTLCGTWMDDVEAFHSERRLDPLTMCLRSGER